MVIPATGNAIIHTRCVTGTLTIILVNKHIALDVAINPIFWAGDIFLSILYRWKKTTFTIANPAPKRALARNHKEFFAANEQVINVSIVGNNIEPGFG